MQASIEPETVAAVRLASRQMVRELGLLRRTHPWGDCSLTEGYVLLELDRHQELRVQDLVATLNLDKSTISRAITHLLRGRLVTGRANAFDRRSKWFALTKAGRKLVEKIHRYAEEQVASALKEMPIAEQRQLAGSMSAYAKALRRVRVREQFTIRPIKPDDDDALLNLFVYVRREHVGFDEAMRLSYPDDHNLSRSFKSARSRYCVVEREGSVVGGAGIAPLKGGDSDTCELQKMYLLPEARGIGLGRALLDSCVGFARENGFRRLYAETNAMLSDAVALYKEYGFDLLDNPLGKTGHAAVTDCYLALRL
jgi:putative acetyltransferase